MTEPVRYEETKLKISPTDRWRASAIAEILREYFKDDDFFHIRVDSEDEVVIVERITGR